MKIAALQMVSTTSVESNLETARRLIAHAARDGAELVALPEYFCLMGRADRDKLAVAEAPGDGPIQSMLADAARAHGVWLIGGTLPIRCGDPSRVLNSNCVFAPDGSLAGKIVFVDYQMKKARDGSDYRNGGGIRGGGPSLAITKGAAAFLMRSAGTGSSRTPHTGATRFADGLTPIPSAALALPDADQLARLLALGPTRVRVALDCG